MMQFKDRHKCQHKIAFSAKSGFFIILLLLSIFLPLINPNKAFADENFQPLELSKIYQSTTFLASCVRATGLRGNTGVAGMNKGISAGDLKGGRFLNDSKLMDLKDAIGGALVSIPGMAVAGIAVLKVDPSGAINVGYSVPGAKNGKLKCSNSDAIKKSMEGTGLTYKELLVDSGLYKLDTNGSKYIIQKDPPNNNDDRAALIFKAVLNKHPDLKDNKRLKVMQYYNLMESLNECGLFDDSNGVPIKFIEEPGSDPVEKKKGVEKGLTENAISVGGGMPGDGKHDGVMVCKTIIDQINILAGDVAQIMKDMIEAGITIDGSNSSLLGDPDAGAPTCETSGFNLSWIMCPIITGFAETSDTIFNQMVQPLLVSRDLGYTDPNRDAISSNEANKDQKNLFQIWSTFRILANILLVIALLIIVIGQSIGGGMIDAYTVKKTLPRLVLAAILVNISIYLVVIALDVTNIVGSGINNLLLAPLRGTDQAIVRLSVGGQGMITLTAGLGLLGVIVAAGSMGGLLVLFLLVALILVLAVLAVLMTLVVRQGIIIFLVLTSPVAFVLYALPNTEQYFKKWWSLLFKTLLVYPIVMIILSMSYMMSILLSGTFPQGVQWVADVVSILLMIIPLFLIPFAFKFAGGMTGTLFNALSNNPLSKLAKQGVAKQAAKGAKMSAMKAKTGHFAKGSRFIPGSNRIAGMINRGTRGVGAGFKTGAKRAAYYDTLEMGNAEGIMQSEQFKGIQFNNDAMHALTYNSEQEAYENLRQRFMRDDPNLSEDDANRRARDAAKIASLVGRFGGAYSVAAARQLAINKDGYANSAEAMDIVNRVASNNSSLRKSLMENVKFTSKQVSRSDLGALGDMNEEEQALYNSGDVEGARALWSDRMTLEGLETADDASLARMHKMGMKNAEDAITRHHGSGSSLSGKATTAATDLTKAGLYATRGNREHINPLGRLETGETFTPKSSDTTETLQDPNDPGKLITRPVSEQPRNETIIDVALRQPGTQNPNDPNNQPPAGEGGAGAGP